MRNNSMMLKRPSVQALFNGYYHDTGVERGLNSQGDQKETQQKQSKQDKNDFSSIYQQESTYNVNQQTGPAQTVAIR